MVLNSLRETFSYILRYPPLILLSGIWAGCIVSAVEYCMFNGLDFYGESIGFFGVIAFPFFIGGASYEMIRRDDRSLTAFCAGGVFPGILRSSCREHL
ncbi:hypothetical protein [Methanogenium cariaci]|uniref:hypothetical protein n=1 Tax=Methanogenium cariaci TaxID=2197 RepID=UPI000780C25A|nr:hypothetical protein [Methanogenium cariaci]